LPTEVQKPPKHVATDALGDASPGTHCNGGGQAAGIYPSALLCSSAPYPYGQPNPLKQTPARQTVIGTYRGQRYMGIRASCCAHNVSPHTHNALLFPTTTPIHCDQARSCAARLPRARPSTSSPWEHDKPCDRINAITPTRSCCQIGGRQPGAAATALHPLARQHHPPSPAPPPRSRSSPEAPPRLGGSG
jgi:hypothetical protein